MATDRFEIEPDEPRREKSMLSGCLLGCLIVIGISLLLAVVAGIWVARNWKDWISDIGMQAVDGILEESGLDEQEKTEVREQMQRLSDAFRAGELEGARMGTLLEDLVKSPLFASLMVGAVEKGYLDESGLAEEEKAEGRITLRRFVRGMVDETLTEQDFDEVISHIADRGPNGEWELREKATDEELRALLKTAKEKADAAEVPVEIEEVDPSDELKRIIDAALVGEPAAPIEVEEPAGPEAEVPEE